MIPEQEALLQENPHMPLSMQDATETEPPLPDHSQKHWPSKEEQKMSPEALHLCNIMQPQYRLLLQPSLPEPDALPLPPLRGRSQRMGRVPRHYSCHRHGMLSEQSFSAIQMRLHMPRRFGLSAAGYTRGDRNCQPARHPM